MILVDNALKAREAQGQPIRVGMIGAGFMGQGLTNQIVNSVPGMRMAAVSNRHLEKALHVFHYAGLENVIVATISLTRVSSMRAPWFRSRRRVSDPGPA